MYIGSRVITVKRVSAVQLNALQSKGFTVVIDTSSIAMYSRVNASRFHSALADTKALGGNFESVHLYTSAEYSSMTCYLSSDSKSGYALKGTELVSVFSLVSGRGSDLVKNAIANGASHLDAFDGYLPKLYSKHGFREYKREPNWDKNGPDVVFMELVA